MSGSARQVSVRMQRVELIPKTLAGFRVHHSDPADHSQQPRIKMRMAFAVLSLQTSELSIVQDRSNATYGLPGDVQPVIDRYARDRLPPIWPQDARLACIEPESFVFNNVSNPGQDVADRRSGFSFRRPRDVIGVAGVGPAETSGEALQAAIQLLHDQI